MYVEVFGIKCHNAYNLLSNALENKQNPPPKMCIKKHMYVYTWCIYRESAKANVAKC